MKCIAILGGGSWGTALAIVLSRTQIPHELSLWVRDAALAESIRRDRENKPYLQGHRVPDAVQVSHDAEAALRNVDLIIGAIPAAHARSVYQRVLQDIARDVPIVSADVFTMRIAARGAWMDVLNSVQMLPSRGLRCPMAATSALLRLRTQASSNEQRKQVDSATARMARVAGSMASVCIAPWRGEHPYPN